MSKKSPLQIVKDKFGSKEKLVAKAAEVLEAREGESADDLKNRLKHVANAKLLRLIEVAEKAKGLGGRSGLVDKVAELKGQTKDADFKTKLGSLSIGSLVDMQASLARRAKN